MPSIEASVIGLVLVVFFKRAKHLNSICIQERELVRVLICMCLCSTCEIPREGIRRLWAATHTTLEEQWVFFSAEPSPTLKVHKKNITTKVYLRIAFRRGSGQDALS